MSDLAFKPAPGVVMSESDLQLLGRVLHELKTRNGEVTPEALVDYARDRRSEIHHLFIWDDRVAAMKYRLQRATYYTTAVIVSTARPIISKRVEIQEAKPARAARGAKPRNEDVRSTVMDMADEELRSWAKRFSTLKNDARYAGVFAAIEALRADEKRVA
jgi:hypothetical protein